MSHKVKLYHCWRCSRYKIADDFYVDNSRKSGLGSRCRKCSRRDADEGYMYILNRIKKRLENMSERSSIG